ncbi:biopolymer transporter ExbD [Acidisphaera sp. S103]|uniref:ExbD/TolR family protein n=1 Tax=Acidisphaera sp. S103 TaxID=1747223 RepID=UPI00131EC7B7|nr:biopolymer transporter ExbD [Acidisphaera sp. S103]
MKLRSAHKRRRGRIEIIPMIDVMFFLLATFMLASLTMQNLHSLRVDLPQGSATPLAVSKSVTLTVTATGNLFLDKVPVTLDTLASALKPPEGRTVVVAADRAAPNGTVVEAMLQAREAGVEEFVFAIRKE